MKKPIESFVFDCNCILPPKSGLNSVHIHPNSDLGTVDVHVPGVVVALPHIRPVLTVHVSVLALEPALVTGHRAVHQHPAGVLLALVQAGPGGAVLVGVLAARLHPGLAGWLRCGLHSDGASTYLGFPGTFVQSVDLPDISVRETLSLSYLTLCRVLWNDCLLSPGLNRHTTVELFLRKPSVYLGECRAAVVHYRAGVILCSQVVDLVQVVLQEVELHPGLDVAPVDGDVTVPVRPTLLVPEPRGVHELVDDDPCVDTAVAQTDLLSRSSPTNAAATTASLHDVDVTSLGGSRYESNASLLVVLLHRLGDDASLPAVE